MKSETYISCLIIYLYIFIHGMWNLVCFPWNIIVHIYLHDCGILYISHMKI